MLGANSSTHPLHPVLFTRRRLLGVTDREKRLAPRVLPLRLRPRRGPGTAPGAAARARRPAISHRSTPHTPQPPDLPFQIRRRATLALLHVQRRGQRHLHGASALSLADSARFCCCGRVNRAEHKALSNENVVGDFRRGASASARF